MSIACLFGNIPPRHMPPMLPMPALMGTDKPKVNGAGMIPCNGEIGVLWKEHMEKKRESLQVWATLKGKTVVSGFEFYFALLQ